MFLTIKEAAEALSCSETHVRRMVRAGKLEYTDIGLGTMSELRVQLPQPKRAEGKKKRKKECLMFIKERAQ